ncbi:MAG TPA: hypothetical protein VF089_08505 [Candidatus Binatia bacterium]
MHVQSYRAGKIKLAQRMVTEARAGKHQFDVLLSSAFTTLEMKLQKLLAKYESPERAHYRAAAPRLFLLVWCCTPPTSY